MPCPHDPPPRSVQGYYVALKSHYSFQRDNNTGEKGKILYLFRREIRPLLVLADNLWNLEIRRQDYIVKQRLGVLQEANCNGPLGEMPGRVVSGAKVSGSRPHDS